MTDKLLKTLQCPQCAGSLETAAGALRCANGHTFHATGGIPDLVSPPVLAASDAEFLEKYDTTANAYETGLRWLFTSFREDEDAVRSLMADALGPVTGGFVLEVGAGTGADSQRILERVGPNGFLVATDLSRGMLEIARTKLNAGDERIAFVLCNGSYLPFRDRAFDAVFHFGGINEFSEKRRSISEMARVTKIGGRVVFGDESVPPWLRDKTFGRVLMNANKLYRHVPPLDDLPEAARNVQLRWVLGGAFYLLSFDVGEGAPYVDLDLPIPGKGDSLRSRFERAYPDERL